MPPHRDAPHITQVLRRARSGDSAAEDELWTIAYDELKSIARRQLRSERRLPGLRTTALVHEAYLRLAGSDGLAIQDRRHFYALASRMMRRHLVDRARRRDAAKRGGDGGESPSAEPAPLDACRQMEALDVALADLATVDVDKARVVEMRFFGGYSNEEIAEALGCSARTVQRHWNMARAWLFASMNDGDDG